MLDYDKLLPIQEWAESGGNPNAVSSKGAIGPMQTMRPTLAKPGYSVRPAENDSPEETRRVGQDYSRAMGKEYGEALPDMLAAYNWGPGNFNKWRDSGRDPAKMPKETKDYIAKISAKYYGEGGAPVVEAGAGRGAVNPPNAVRPVGEVAARWEQWQAEQYQRGLYTPTGDEGTQRLIAEGIASRKLAADTAPTGLEAFGAAMMGSTGITITRHLMRPRYEDEAGFVPNLTLLPREADSDLIHNYATATSSAKAAEELQWWNDEQLRLKTVAEGGVGNSLLRSVGAELIDLTSIIVPFAGFKALAKLGAGSAKLFAEGRVGAGYASAIGENLISGTVLEAVKQSVEGEFKPADLGISLLADSLLGVGFGALSSRTVGHSIIDRAAAHTVAREADLATRAELKLGKLASVEEVGAEMEIIRKADANAVITDALADVADADKLISDVPAWKRPSWPKGGKTVIGNEEYPNLPAAPVVEEVGSAGASARVAPDTPEFRAFFDNSAVVSPDGAPRIVYHQTLADVGSFDPATRGANTGAGSAKEAFFFAGTPKTTDAYGQNRTGSNIVPVYLSMQNPLVHDVGGVVKRSVRFTDLVAEAKAKGHDGVIIKNTYDGGDVDDIYAVFENTQIKSAIGNSGAYSKTDPRITHGPATGGVILERKVIATAPVKESLERALTSPALLNEASPDSRGARQLINHLLTILPEGVLKQDVNFVGYGARGSFNPVTDVLDTPGRAAADLMPSNGKVPNEAVILAHEVVHAATAKMIDAVEMGLAGVTKDMHKAVSNLAAIRRDLEAELRKLGKLDKSSEFGANYATKNLHEFVAQVMSDADTRGVLAAMPARGFVDRLTEFANAVMRLLGFNPKAGNTALQEAVTLIEKVIKEGPPPVERVTVTRTGLNGPLPADVVDELLQDPDYIKYGLTGLPLDTPAKRKEAQAILALHKEAAVWEQKYPYDDAWKSRMKNLADNQVFNVASTGLKMLSSPSPVVRMVAHKLLEDASGVAGKRVSTAAIHKHTVERLMKGNAENDIQRAYEFWKKGKPGGHFDDMIGGKNWAAYNKELTAEIEARAKAGSDVSTDPSIKGAADSIGAAYQRAANEMRRVNTLGSEGLPLSSFGYMPHRMSAKMFVSLSNEKKQVVHSALVDQFVSKGWDITFSDQLAAKYLDLARKRAAGDYGSAMGGAGSSDQIREALVGMGLPEDVVAKHMDTFSKGGAGFTKGRLELDLNKVYTVGGEDFKLLDIYETDQIELLRSQIGRASGEVALTKFGVRGKPGADIVFNALQFGEDGKRAGDSELQSFEQVMAEFFNEPYGKSGGKFLDRAMLANSLVAMGSSALNQASETINGIAHVGFLRAMASIPAIPRLRQELLALARGEKVDNPIIGSIEQAGGAEFGADGYKFVMPHDNPNNLYPAYGQDTPTLLDRLLRGGNHVQAILSGHRMLHATQQRGMAEQIVHKMARYIRDGKDDIALDQFGIHSELRDKLRQDIGQWATFDGDRLVRFEADKITDPEVREAVIQSVWRGTQQIIQGTFIGERGKWVHDGMLRMMTQFRSFSITSMEKQWGRQRNSHGVFGATGIILGAMSLAWPIYAARTYAASIGRPDQEAWLEERLSPQHVARATMNYVAGLGMVPDLLDMGTTLLPDDWGVKTTGGRSGVETDFVGNYIAPASSLVDNIWKYAQSPLEVEDAMRIAPFSRLPFVIPMLNTARD